jgi:hypothetical protein
MKLLRRTLYWEAALLVIGGALFAIAPEWVLRGVFEEPTTVDTWVRVAGIQAFGLGLVSVVIAHRIEQLWWASWADVIVAAGVAVVAFSHAALGAPSGRSPLLWWALGLVAVLFAAPLLVGLAIAGTERDPHD